MLKLQVAATLLTAATLVSPAWQASSQTIHRGLKQPPIVSVTDAPAGTETFAMTWIRVAVPDRGVMLAAVARPSGAGPFPVVILLHESPARPRSRESVTTRGAQQVRRFTGLTRPNQ